MTTIACHDFLNRCLIKSLTFTVTSFSPVALIGPFLRSTDGANQFCFPPKYQLNQIFLMISFSNLFFFSDLDFASKQKVSYLADSSIISS